MNHPFASAEERHEAGLLQMTQAARAGDADLWDESAALLIDAPANILGEAMDSSRRRPRGNSEAFNALVKRGVHCLVGLRVAGRSARKGGRAAEAQHLLDQSERLRGRIKDAVGRMEAGPMFMDPAPREEAPAETLAP